MNGPLLHGDLDVLAVVMIYDAMRAADREAGWLIFMEAVNAAIEQATAAAGQKEREALAQARPMLAKLADDQHWDEVTWFGDREPCVGFVFTGDNEQGQTCDASEYAKDILAVVDAGLFSPSRDVADDRPA